MGELLADLALIFPEKGVVELLCRHGQLKCSSDSIATFGTCGTSYQTHSVQVHIKATMAHFNSIGSSDVGTA